MEGTFFQKYTNLNRKEYWPAARLTYNAWSIGWVQSKMGPLKLVPVPGSLADKASPR
jgi:hypothetical protein